VTVTASRWFAWFLRFGVDAAQIDLADLGNMFTAFRRYEFRQTLMSSPNRIDLRICQPQLHSLDFLSHNNFPFFLCLVACNS
jgi:hypothetical protein